MTQVCMCILHVACCMLHVHVHVHVHRKCVHTCELAEPAWRRVRWPWAEGRRRGCCRQSWRRPKCGWIRPTRGRRRLARYWPPVMVTQRYCHGPVTVLTSPNSGWQRQTGKSGLTGRQAGFTRGPEGIRYPAQPGPYNATLLPFPPQHHTRYQQVLHCTGQLRHAAA